MVIFMPEDEGQDRVQQRAPRRRRSLLDYQQLTDEDIKRAKRHLVCGLTLPCVHCQGRGYVIADEPHGTHLHAQLCNCIKQCPLCLGAASAEEDGIARPCRRPSPAMIVSLLNEAMIPFVFSRANFESYRSLKGRDQRSLNLIEAWRAQLKSPQGRGLLLSGPIGVGKSYFLTLMAREFAERGWSVRYIDSFQLQFELRAGFAENKADATQLDPLCKVDVLIIDELGKGRGRDYERSVLDHIISRRYDAKKMIVASTNYRLDDVTASHRAHISIDQQVSEQEFDSEQFGFLEKRIGSRCFSRLRQMTEFVRIDGPDFRRGDKAR